MDEQAAPSSPSLHPITSSPHHLIIRPDGLATPLQFVKGVGPRVALTLQKMGLHTAEDMLFHFPHRWEDRSNFRPLGQARHGETVCTSGEVAGVTIDRTARRGLLLTRVLIRDASGPAEL